MLTPPTTAHVPTLAGLPLLGNLIQLRRNILGLMLRIPRECGPVGQFRVAQRTLTVVTSPAYLQTILVEQAEDFEKTPRMRGALSPLLGNGLLTSMNQFHKRQRRLVAPAFQQRRIGAYAETMVQESLRAAEGWQAGQSVDVAHEMMRLTLAIVGKTLFDADVLSEADELGQALTVANRAAINQLTGFIQLPRDWPTPHNRRMREALERLNNTIYSMIEERRHGSQERDDLLSMLLTAQDADGSFMTDQQVRDEAMTIFLAGHETTATALAWTWYLLAKHPHCHSRMQAEVRQALGERSPTANDLPALPYTLQVFKEALRLYPPAYIFSRQASRPFELGPYHFPAGALVVMSPYAIHRQPDLYTDPECFDPDRWTPTREAALPRHAFLPFGGGPRICVGNHFALMEGQLVLATLAQRLRFDLVPGQQVEPEPLITLRPKGGIKMVVQKG